MKIAYFCATYPPTVSGAAKVANQLVDGMAGLGHSTLVVTPSDKGRPYSKVVDGQKIARFRSFRNPVRVDHNFMLWPKREISAELQDFRPYILHFHDPVLTAFSMLFSRQALNAPLVLTLHSLPWAVANHFSGWKKRAIEKYFEPVLWKIVNWIIHQCDVVISPSDAIAEIVFKRVNIRPEVLSNGVDLNCFSPLPAYPKEGESLRKEYSLDPHLPIILYCGRIDADKKVDVVIRAAAQVFRSIDSQLLVIGDGKHLDEVISLSEKLGIKDRCHFPGVILPTSDLPGMYRLASVFVSASEVEIQSLTFLEAEANALPIVAIGTASIHELVNDGESGFLVAPGDVNAMAEKIVKLLQDPELAGQMGQKGLLRAKKHSLSKFIGAHEKLYNSIVNKQLQA